MTGQGGWPMTVVLDHDGEPFFAGTYFPDRARGGHAGVPAGARGASPRPGRDPARRRTPGGRGPARRTCRPDVGCRPATPTPSTPPCSTRRGRARCAGLRRATARRVRRRARSSRRRWCSSCCCGTRARTGDPGRAGDGRRDAARRWPAAASTTSSAAASRATPSTGRGWCRTSRRCSTTTRSCSASTPLVAARRRWASGSPRETADFLLRELRHRRGRLRRPRSTPTPRASRARFYVWTPAQLRRGARRATTARGPPTLLEVTAAGTFEHGASTLQLLARPADRRRGRLADVRGRLLAARARAGPAGPRRQGGRRLERAGDRRARRRRRAARTRGPRRRRGRRGHAARRPAPATRRAAAPGLPRRRRRPAPRRARGPRLRGARLPGAAPAPPATRPGWTGRGPARPRARAVPRRGRRLLRHRRRRRGAGRPAARPVRQRQPVGHVGAGARAAGRAALTGEGRYRRGRRGGAAAPSRALAAQAPRFAGWSLAAAEAVAAGPLEVAVVGPAGTGARRAGAGRAVARPGVTVVVVAAGPTADIAAARRPRAGRRRAPRRTSAAGWSASGRSRPSPS